jgi:hypothetical protein
VRTRLRPSPALRPEIFDPTGLGPIPGVPLIPEAIRRRHHVFVETDTRFRQAARFCSICGGRPRAPIGHYTDGTDKVRKLGSRISAKAGELGANFIDPAILPIVNHALVYRESGAVYDLDRLKTNLLSSQPLVFNTFGLLKRDLRLATRFMAELLPGTFAEVTDILFETSPGRGDPRFTGDGTAFDLAILGRSPAGQRLFCAWELKYSESGHEPVPRFTGCFDRIAERSGLFVDSTDPALKRNPVQQSFRQLCLAQAVLDNGLADRAMLLFVAPQLNHPAQAGAHAFSRHLADPLNGSVPFIPLSLEQVFSAIAAAGLPDHARALHRRYTDFWLIDGELQLEAALVTPARAAPADSAATESVSRSSQPKAPTRRRPSPRTEAA